MPPAATRALRASPIHGYSAEVTRCSRYGMSVMHGDAEASRVAAERA